MLLPWVISKIPLTSRGRYVIINIDTFILINLKGMIFLKHMDAVRTFKALADDNRLEIMRLLIEGEKCGCVLLEALEIGQPTLSHHMRILCDSGLVNARKKGTWMHYSISKEGALKIRNMVDHYVVYSDQDAEKASVSSQKEE